MRKIILLLALGGTFIGCGGGSDHGAHPPGLDLIGLNLEQAQERLGDAGYSVLNDVDVHSVSGAGVLIARNWVVIKQDFRGDHRVILTVDRPGAGVGTYLLLIAGVIVIGVVVAVRRRNPAVAAAAQQKAKTQVQQRLCKFCGKRLKQVAPFFGWNIGFTTARYAVCPNCGRSQIPDGGASASAAGNIAGEAKPDSAGVVGEPEPTGGQPPPARAPTVHGSPRTEGEEPSAVGMPAIGSLPVAFRECPFCKESMRRDASVCPHCRRKSKAWAYHDQRWWTEAEDGSEVWLDETSGRWLPAD